MRGCNRDHRSAPPKLDFFYYTLISALDLSHGTDLRTSCLSQASVILLYYPDMGRRKALKRIAMHLLRGADY